MSYGDVYRVRTNFPTERTFTVVELRPLLPSDRWWTAPDWDRRAVLAMVVEGSVHFDGREMGFGEVGPLLVDNPRYVERLA